MKYHFTKILSTFGFSNDIRNTANNKIREVEEKISYDIYGNEDLKKAYKNSLSGMRTEFVKEVSKNCKGYSMQMELKLNELIEKSSTINELLHVFHSYIVNNDKLLQSLPVVKQKCSGRNKYTVYGMGSNDVADQIFDSINLEKTRMGITDIIALPDRVLMMIRDVGHATTLEIKKDKATNQLGVTYFIPKVCNVNKVNQLPGVTKVTENSPVASTNGMFQIETEDVGKCVVDFIEKIPGDMDIQEIQNDNEIINDETVILKTQQKNVWIERLKRWRDKIKEVPDKAKKLIISLINHNNDKER